MIRRAAEAVGIASAILVGDYSKALDLCDSLWAGPKAVAQPALIVPPAFIARPAQPGVELVLDRALDDHSRPELRQFRERLARVLADTYGNQPVELRLDLRRRRYPVVSRRRPPSSSCQDLREPTPSP
jgi:hypothetical protein